MPQRVNQNLFFRLLKSFSSSLCNKASCFLPCSLFDAPFFRHAPKREIEKPDHAGDGRHVSPDREETSSHARSAKSRKEASSAQRLDRPAYQVAYLDLLATTTELLPATIANPLVLVFFASTPHLEAMGSFSGVRAVATLLVVFSGFGGRSERDKEALLSHQTPPMDE